MTLDILIGVNDRSILERLATSKKRWEILRGHIVKIDTTNKNYPMGVFHENSLRNQTGRVVIGLEEEPDYEFRVTFTGHQRQRYRKDLVEFLEANKGVPTDVLVNARTNFSVLMAYVDDSFDELSAAFAKEPSDKNGVLRQVHGSNIDKYNAQVAKSSGKA